MMKDYRTLGRSGLAVSSFALGTMTFGTARWGMAEDDSRAVFNAFVELGGNFVDTADVYSGGRSEEMLGSFIADRKLRDQLIVATKVGFATGKGPQAGGNSAKYIGRSVEGSLKRLKTEYIDLYWIHVWDSVTPAEELVETMSTLVRAGKIRYWGLSNSPAWYVTKVATIADLRGLPRPIALQYFYSLVNRDVEHEHIPAALECGLGIVPWSPLAFGLLTGKYDRTTVEKGAPRAGGLPNEASTTNAMRPHDDKRLDGANPFGDSLFNERNWQIVDELRRVAKETGESPARAALAWIIGRPGVTSTLMGVSKPAQVADNAASLKLNLSPEHRAALDKISTDASPSMLYSMFTPEMRSNVVFGGSSVTSGS